MNLCVRHIFILLSELQTSFLHLSIFILFGKNGKSLCRSCNFGNKKYKLFDVTKFILVLPTFRLKQQSLSRTRC